MIKQLVDEEGGQYTVGDGIECNGKGNLRKYKTQEQWNCPKYSPSISTSKGICIHRRSDGYCESEQNQDGNRIRAVLDELDE